MSRPFHRSRRDGLLVTTTVGVALVAVALPFVPRAGVVGLVPLTGGLMTWILLATSLYVAATELQKRYFYARNAQ